VDVPAFMALLLGAYAWPAEGLEEKEDKTFLSLSQPALPETDDCTDDCGAPVTLLRRP
jgi:hypothetical protein